MKKIHLLIALISFMTAACQTTIKPAIIPPQTATVSPTPGLKLIGGVEHIYFPPMEASFAARIDTGAETSSIDVNNLRAFERDGEKWVTFTLINNQNNERHVFEKRLVRHTHIRRSETNEHRHVVMMDIKIGDEIITAEFTLANREKFAYQALIGRNILNGRFIVNPAVENTLY